MKVWIKKIYNFGSIIDLNIPRWLYVLHGGELDDEWIEWEQIEVTPHELKKLLDQREHIRI
jgi:hypothetical protein